MEAIVHTAQKPLKATYRTTPALAMVTDHARTGGVSIAEPFRTRVEPMDGCGVFVPIETHAALGGPHQAPTPGDLLCAALAACQDSAFRMVANLLGIELTRLEVVVTATVDVRGCLAMDLSVPVGFQAMTCAITYAVQGDPSAHLLEKLQIAARQCCVVQQTIKSPPLVQTTFQKAGAP